MTVGRQNPLRVSPGLILSAPRSGAGKTTGTLGLLRALRRSGVVVQPFKCGPDYIDPAFHAAAAGRESFNLDTWAMRTEVISFLIGQAATGADICLTEGVMGLFDGVAERGQAGRGSTADLAALTGWPVILVLDVAGQTETAAAVALGCQSYRDDVKIAGVILNRVAGERHERLVRRGFDRIDIPVIGAIPRDDALALPERHLGLVQANETDGLDSRLDTIADRIIAAHVDLAALRALARPTSLPHSGRVALVPPPGQRIALAQDQAFSFMYPHVLAGWRAAGAGILPFSPLADEAPAADADAIWLPGGYPELHAGALANATRFLNGLRDAARRGAAVHGECGGYMVLGDGLIDVQGSRHTMAGLLRLETSFAARKRHLGYRRASILGGRGQLLFGHEFHYATTLACHDEPLAEITDAQGAPVDAAGSRAGNVTGTFFHLIDGAAA